MNPKERYRLRLKLQSALFRIVEVVEEMKKAGVGGNAADLFAADTVMRILSSFLNAGDDPTKMTEAVPVHQPGIDALKDAARRKYKETHKRKVRRWKQAARRKKPPSP